jgi:hypothetical protein
MFERRLPRLTFRPVTPSPVEDRKNSSNTGGDASRTATDRVRVIGPDMASLTLVTSVYIGVNSRVYQYRTTGS